MSLPRKEHLQINIQPIHDWDRIDCQNVAETFLFQFIEIFHFRGANRISSENYEFKIGSLSGRFTRFSVTQVKLLIENLQVTDK